MKLFSETAERGVLSAIVRGISSIEELVDYCEISDFVNNKIKSALHTAEELSGQGVEVNLTTMAARLEECFTNGDWVRFLGAAAKDSITPLAPCAQKVRELSDRRRLCEAAQDVLMICSDPNINIDEQVDRAQSRVLGAVERKTDNLKDAKQQIKSVIDQIELRVNSKGFYGLHTGWDDLSDSLGGLLPGELVTVAARPGMGKTNLALNVFASVVGGGGSALFVSMEMGAEELGARILSNWADIEYSKFHTGDLDGHDWTRFTDTVKKKYHEAKSLIDDSSTQTIGSIRATARRIKQREGLDLIVVDHIGLIDQDGESDTSKISKISRELKRLAKDMNCPVMMLSQLNRSVEQRNNRRPMLSDLRQSGSIEQDSDAVLLLYRDEYYNEQSANRGIGEINIAKNRKGTTGTVLLGTQFDYCRFVETDRVVQEAVESIANKSRAMNY